MSREVLISVPELVKAYMEVQQSGGTIEDLAKKTELTVKQVEAKVASLKNPPYKTEMWVEDNLPVYRTEEEHVEEVGETTTFVQYAKVSNKTGAYIRATRQVLDESGEPILTRKPLPLPPLKRKGRANNETIDEALQLLADLQGITLEELQEQQEKTEEKKLERFHKNS